ncbi:hypothetical protein GLOTRDRAFT_132725 [Gloeophyllum trabeum ATCC 11539]|uniref:Uncharacterized protein n=1 Tax=Gloeophyllum trabeum (strain ATCC 11539 / FP-39264 / Madison 617) TaxID=670483 RepID=S7RH60_GLOTA|nr:uncharacterized protein GLOTRDRAFT_132725 [Gloeophyllum trabeum ATCC 11539]EPQ51914.1 hypothetical protein GLOTRDRAFT_132725 [Gloeophyllum trabeum ATCC 11539]
MLSQAYKSVAPVPGCEPLSQPLLAAGGPPPAIEWLADAATGGPLAARLYTGRSRIRYIAPLCYVLRYLHPYSGFAINPRCALIF